MEKRDKFLNQPVIEGYKDFDILFHKNGHLVPFQESIEELFTAN